MNGIAKNQMFDTNPTNWLMPSFVQRADSNTIRRNRREIIDILRGFRDIMSEDKEMKEGRSEIMRREIERG